jgi:hypothetical protein
MIPDFKSYTNEKALLVVLGLILVELKPKDYLLETWRYHTNRHSKGFSSTRIRPCTTSRAFSFV